MEKQAAFPCTVHPRFHPSCLSSLSRCIMSRNPQLSSNCRPSGTNGTILEIFKKPEHDGNSVLKQTSTRSKYRLSGFTLNTCCKSGELLLITGRSSSKACLKTARKQAEGLGKVARSRARFCLAAQHARDGIEPAALTWSEGLLPDLFASAPLMKPSCSNAAEKKRMCSGMKLFQLKRPAVCFLC